MFGLRRAAAAMVRRGFAPHPPITKKSLPNFLDKMERLSKVDRMKDEEAIAHNLTKGWPAEHHEAIRGLDAKTRGDLDFIKVCYRPPLSPGRRAHAREKLVHIIKSKEWTDAELDLFVHVLRWCGCDEDEVSHS